MKPHPRIRKTVKWGGAAATVLLVVVWIGSGWLFVGFATEAGSAVYFTAGGVGVQTSRRYAIDSPFDWGSRKAPLWSLWDWECRSSGPGPPSFHTPPGFSVFGPLWPFMMPIAGTTVIAWRLDTLARRRARLNLCPKCDYDRTGLADGAVCPECGSAPP